MLLGEVEFRTFDLQKSTFAFANLSHVLFSLLQLIHHLLISVLHQFPLPIYLPLSELHLQAQ